MDSLDSGVGYGAVPLAEETQQRLGPAASLTSRLAFQHALFEDIVKDRVILDVESKITHCCHLFHDRWNGPAQLSENYQTCRGVAPGGGVEFRKTRQDAPDVLASIAVPGIELARHLPPAPLMHAWA